MRAPLVGALIFVRFLIYFKFSYIESAALPMNTDALKNCATRVCFLSRCGALIF